jgi:hypothetical protein
MGEQPVCQHFRARFQPRGWRAGWRGAIPAGDGKAGAADALPQHKDGGANMRAPPMQFHCSTITGVPMDTIE